MRKKAHHMPALKIPSANSQLCSSVNTNANDKNWIAIFIETGLEYIYKGMSDSLTSGLL